jgi:hypothetical protein
MTTFLSVIIMSGLNTLTYSSDRQLICHIFNRLILLFILFLGLLYAVLCLWSIEFKRTESSDAQENRNYVFIEHLAIMIGGVAVIKLQQRSKRR